MSNWKQEKYLILLFILLLASLLSSCSESSRLPSIGSMHSGFQPTATSTESAAERCSQSTPGTTKRVQDNQIQVTVNTACMLGISNYEPGLTHSDNSLFEGGIGDPTAIAQVQDLMSGTITYENAHIMGWGAPDPWPDPTSSGPTDWSGIDSRLNHALSVGATPVLSLDEAPWWMKGQLQANGTTTALTASQEWTDTAYASRVMDNKMGDWLRLIQDVAERYMVPPYNVRYFQVWNELKGYYDPKLNNYDFTTSPGDPSGPNAKHGYTYMYNQVYATLMKVATSLHIPTDQIKVGGPYVFMDVYASANQSNPSNLRKSYGVFDQRSLDVMQYWLQHKTGAGFITFDASNESRLGKILGNPFDSARIFADTINWIRSLDPTLYPGSTTLPIWLAEWFASPGISGLNADYDNAVKSYAMSEFIKAGGSVAMSWGGSGDGTSDEGYWTPTTQVGGGQPMPWYTSVKELHADFSKGAKIYFTAVSDATSVGALATAGKIMLINKTDTSLTVRVDNGSPVTLTPYQVTVMDYIY